LVLRAWHRSELAYHSAESHSRTDVILPPARNRIVHFRV
jgi:hypothetical protein